MAADRNLQRNARNWADHAMMVPANPKTPRFRSGTANENDTVHCIELILYFYIRVSAVGPFDVIPVIASSVEANPGIRVSLSICNSQEALHSLMEFRCDVAMLASTRIEPQVPLRPLRLGTAGALRQQGAPLGAAALGAPEGSSSPGIDHPRGRLADPAAPGAGLRRSRESRLIRSFLEFGRSVAKRLDGTDPWPREAP